MPFSEKTKLEVKQKAAFRCCICQRIGVQVHHIIPEEHGGSDEMDNAASLCPNCHSSFGDNPSKRKEITQMRDWWYDKSKSLFTAMDTDLHLLEKIDILVKDSQKNKDDMSELKGILKDITYKRIDNMNPRTVSSTTSGLLSASLLELSRLRPETEVRISLNVLYDSIYGGGIDQLHVSESLIGYRITLKAKGTAISRKIINDYIDGSLKDKEVTRKHIVSIFEELRKPSEYLNKGVRKVF